uniref:Uncharacterized protein n=1 Tax=Anguilla anguilla TaxID=7936 RepID=A0A0E9XW34_ANGAN
MKMSLMEIRII